jgi:hypothetical protein
VTGLRIAKQSPAMKWTPTVVAEWVELLESGVTRKEIKERYGVADSTLSQKLGEYHGV